MEIQLRGACSCSNESGITREALKGKFEIIREFPFDSTRKMMSVIVRDREGKKFVVTKGAPDVLLQMSQTILWGISSNH